MDGAGEDNALSVYTAFGPTDEAMLAAIQNLWSDRYLTCTPA